MTIIRWGIIGAGRIAHTFAQDMPATGNGVIRAVAARDRDAAAEFANRYDISTAYGGYDGLYSDPDVDAVYIATPHSLHLHHATDALRSGKAVMCEKPLTVDAAQCQQLIEVAATTSCYLMEAMWTWFLPAIQRAKQWVTAGRIGKVVQIQSDFGYPQIYSPDRREYAVDLGGGCLLEMGVYPVALTALFAEAEPTDVEVVSRHAPNGVEDDVVAIFNYNDFVATIGTSFRAKLRNWAYIIGEDGYIAIPDFWRATECQLWVLDELVDRYEDDRSTNGFDYQIKAVNDDLAAGRKQSAIMPLSASLRFQKHMELIRSRF